MRRSSTSRSARADLVAFALAGVVATAAAPAAAQSIHPTLGDPQRCVVVLESMGDVGFRISDAQVVADAVLQALKKRVGQDGATYAGIKDSAAAMKRLLKTPEGAGPQEAQLAYFAACEKAAPWRVTARFGTDKKKKGAPHWVSVACRRADTDADSKAPPVEEKRFEGKTFLEARDQLAAAMPTFCGAIPSVGVIPVEPAPGAHGAGGPNGVAPKKKEPKPWTPPPRRD